MASEDYESKIESKVAARALAELGVFSIKIKAAQEDGYPDREFLIRGGRPLFIEFKRKDEPAKPHQLLKHDRLRHFGYEVQVHDTIAGAMRAIQKAVAAAPKSKAADCVLLRSKPVIPQPRRRSRP